MRIPHNQVERKYREGINRQLERLRDIIPSTRDAALANGYGRLSKNTILTSAIEYIAELQETTRRLQEEKDLVGQIFGLGPGCSNGIRTVLDIQQSIKSH